VGCAPSDTCRLPASAVVRKARATATVCVCVLCHFVLGLPVGLVGYPLNTKINEFSKRLSATWWIKWTEKLHDRSVFNHQKRKEDGNSQKQKQKQKRYIYGGHEQIRTGN
jgi:predicted PurR-regulated permease PerM